ncbi:NUDIX hydrolase [bacterium]|nr:NUDIX hydrolase [bacterium]
MSDQPVTQRLERKRIVENPRIHVFEDRVRLPTGTERLHWKVDYQLDGVGVVPVLDDGRVLLGLHWRYCVERWGWEIAAGGVEADEDHAITAHRELEEETGHRAGRMDFLLDFHPAPGLGNEHFFAFVARDLEPTGAAIDEDEIHELRAFTWEEIQGLLADGKLYDGFTLTSLLLARERGFFTLP